MLHTHTHNTRYKEYIYWTRTHIWNIEMASSWSSDSRWGKCRATFAIYLESFVRSESNILKLVTTPVEIFFNSHAQATKKFKWSVLKLVSSISLADVQTQWPYATHRLPKRKRFNPLCNRLLFIPVTFVVPAIAWLIIPDRKQPTVFDIDTCMRVWNRLNTFCFTDMSTFSTWLSHANTNDRKICLLRY